ncbi:DUF2752 domain-containing protein [Leekyejoonella antrihumi]|nr:DUF2752 domain-containing protein [Leekyejoonella antrihumi]
MSMRERIPVGRRVGVPTPGRLPGTVLHRIRDPLLFGTGVAGAAGVLHFMSPNHPGHYPGCPLLALTGLYCPFCGGLRSVADLTHGDVSGAFARNPLVPLALAAGLVLWARWLVTAMQGRPVRPQLGPGGNRLVLVLAVTFMILRNIPGWTWLSPA